MRESLADALIRGDYSASDRLRKASTISAITLLFNWSLAARI